jgi:hypothetical protein
MTAVSQIRPHHQLTMANSLRRRGNLEVVRSWEETQAEFGPTWMPVNRPESPDLRPLTFVETAPDSMQTSRASVKTTLHVDAAQATRLFWGRFK